jgi:hypothetical protein
LLLERLNSTLPEGIIGVLQDNSLRERYFASVSVVPNRQKSPDASSNEFPLTIIVEFPTFGPNLGDIVKNLRPFLPSKLMSSLLLSGTVLFK